MELAASELAVGDVVEPLAAETAPGEDPEAAEATGEDDGRGRRRGRRGGRRRRREPGEGDPATPTEGVEQESSFDAPAPAPAYVYTGPTPADPFGGQPFDIFDMMDEPDVRVADPDPAPASPEPPPIGVPAHRPEEEGAAGEATVPAELHAPEPVVEVPAPAPLAEPVTPAEPMIEAAAALPAIVEEEPPLLNGHALEPMPEAVTALELAVEPEPPVEAGPTEPVSAPIPPPVLVGSEPAAEKKRGWWRR